MRARCETARSVLDAALAEVGGCGDGNCVVHRRCGMHTNGGCRCNADKHKMSRVLYHYRKFADAVAALALP
jgi:hypothetical protein